MSNSAWLIVALVIVFISIAGYSAGLVLREKRLAARLRELDRDESLKH